MNDSVAPDFSAARSRVTTALAAGGFSVAPVFPSLTLRSWRFHFLVSDDAAMATLLAEAHALVARLPADARAYMGTGSIDLRAEPADTTMTVFLCGHR